MKTELVCEIVGENEEIQGEKVICLVFCLCESMYGMFSGWLQEFKCVFSCVAPTSQACSTSQKL